MGYRAGEGGWGQGVFEGWRGLVWELKWGGIGARDVDDFDETTADEIGSGPGDAGRGGVRFVGFGGDAAGDV